MREHSLHSPRIAAKSEELALMQARRRAPQSGKIPARSNVRTVARPAIASVVAVATVLTLFTGVAFAHGFRSHRHRYHGVVGTVASISAPAFTVTERDG